MGAERSYYETLGVDPDASQSVLERAYRDRVLETHPDHCDAPDAADRFQQVRAAAEVLLDADERARYDRLGHRAYRAGQHDSVRTHSGRAGAPGEPRDPTGDWDPAEWARRWADQQARADDEWTAGSGRSTADSHRPGSGPWRDRTDPFGDVDGDPSPGRDAGSGHGGSPGGFEASGPEATPGPGATPWPGATPGSRRPWERRAAADGWGYPGGVDAASYPGSSGERDREFSYSVHDWDDPVRETVTVPAYDRRTLAIVTVIALVYPLFVFASLTPSIHLLLNVLVATAGLSLVAYLLTLPRLAVVAFGAWSLLSPALLYVHDSIAGLSLQGLGVLGAFWIPFGYALAVWWAVDWAG